MSASDRKTILIVDDTPTNIGIISSVLKDTCRTKVATNGEKALALASADDKPDLILLDITMPGMDGYEVCRRLKANPATRGIPVIFLTAKTEAEDEENKRDRFKAEKRAKSFLVAVGYGVHHTIDELGEPVLFSVQAANQQGCESRRKGQSVEGRNRDRKGNR